MAFATKFRIEGTSDVYEKITVNIKLDGYVGSIIPLEGATRDFVTLKIGSPTNDISQVILPGEASLQFYATSEFQTIEFAQSQPFTYLVEINDGLNENIWTGWIMPEQYSESYTNTPYLVNVTASDSLEVLKNVSPTSFTGSKTTIWNAIRIGLAGTRLGLRYLESVSIYSDEMDANNQDSPFTQAEVINSTFDGMTCYDILESVLKPFFARVYQYRGWRIENITEKRDNHTVRLFNISGVYQSFFNSNSLVQLNNSPSNFSAFIQKSGQLNFQPSLNYSSSYFPSIQRAQATGLNGFDKLTDWTDANNLVSWTNENGITIQRVVTEYNGSEYGVWIDGANPNFSDDEYIQSTAIAVNPTDNQNITIGFDYKMDYPSIIILGSKPILYVEFFLDGTASDYYWTGTQWVTDRKSVRISASPRNVWRSFQANIGVLPEAGNLYIRIHKLVKSGTIGVTKLFLTKFYTNIAVESEETNVYLFAQATTAIDSTFKGPSFEFKISDGLISEANGVIEVATVLTDNWNRAGETDDLPLTSLFLYQWLSFHQYSGAILQGTLYQKGEKITPYSTIEDNPSISTKRYILNLWEISLGTGIGNVQFREIPQTDEVTTIITGTRTQIEPNDYLIPSPGLPTGPSTTPQLTPTTPTIIFDNIRFLNGDVTGDISTSELTPSAIVNKARLDFTGLTADDIVFNAVKNTLDQENMTNLRLSDIRTIIGTIPTAAVIGRYDIDTSGTTAPVGTKDIRYNNATQISATQLFISDITEDGIDVDLFLSLIKQGSALVIQDRDDHLNYQTYEVSGTPTFASATWTFPVTFKDSGGTGTTNFANNHKVLLSALSSGSGTIGGSIASEQVAFGTGVNTVGGDSGLKYLKTTKRLEITDASTVLLGDLVIDKNSANNQFTIISARNRNNTGETSFAIRNNIGYGAFTIYGSLWADTFLRNKAFFTIESTVDALGFNTLGSKPIEFYTNKIYRASFLGNGNFLIGTSTDSGQMVQVNGEIKTNSISVFNNNSVISSYQSGSSANDSIKISNTSGGATLGIQNNNSSGFSGIEYLNNSGNLAVFTGLNNSNGQEFRFNNVATNGWINFRIAGTERITIYNSGNIGLSTTADPSARLAIRGTGTTTGVTLLLEDSGGTDNVQFLDNGNITYRDGSNWILGTTTGTKIGTTTSQKLGFWNATPIIQPTTGVAESAFVENAGGTVINDDSTFDGYTIRQVVKALRDVGLLA